MSYLALAGMACVAIWLGPALIVAIWLSLATRRTGIQQSIAAHPAGSKLPRQSTAPAIESDGSTLFAGRATGRTIRDRCGPAGKCFRHSEVRCSGPIPCCGTCPTDPAGAGVE